MNAPITALPKFLLLLLFSVLIQTGITSAQNEPNPSYIYISPGDFEDGEVLRITQLSPWFYKAGDDPAWANPDFILNEFIHNEWQETDYLTRLDVMPVFEPNGYKAVGNVWFFKEFRVDSKIIEKPFAITGKIYGALEIYLNGNKIGSAGKIGTSRKDEDPKGHFLPISFQWDDSGQQFLAIRYSYHTLREAGFGYDLLGLDLYIGFEDDITKHFETRTGERGLNLIAQSISAGASIVLGILLLFLFILYPKQKQNLIAALLFLSISMGSIGLLISFTIWELPQDLPTIFFFNGLSLSISSFINVWFAHTLTKRKSRWIFWTFAVLSTIFAILTFINAFIVNDFALMYWTVSMIYVVIHFTRARIKHGMKDLDIILIGLAIYLIAFIVMVTMLLTGHIERASLVWLSVISLLVPVSYSFYLARDIARTNELLSMKLDENQRLADEKLRQEQENKRLIETRKEELEEEVKARTAELAEAYKNLQDSHEDLKNTQQQLIQQEKMASLGQLTAGIAHEIKNPLNFVNNFSDVSRELIGELREELDRMKKDKKVNLEGSFIEEILDDIDANVATITKHGKRADSIVHGMLLHSRGKSGEKMPADINKLLDEYTDLSYHGLRAKDPDFNAEIVKDFDPSIGKIEVVPQDITRAFLNIINNGFQAAAEHFKKQGIKQNVELSVKTELSDDKVIIRIKDNGPGIPEKIKNQIFEPFFTTKDAGEGTGLGLSMTYDIIKTHNGTIELHSEEGKGAEFIITLPAGK
ncbi:MAG: GHKL domain-containing protein [Balneolaceae bacterium]|nr:MAG: GHKL domain-containing protein [Balneolaceae bacterium]